MKKNKILIISVLLLVALTIFFLTRSGVHKSEKEQVSSEQNEKEQKKHKPVEKIQIERNDKKKVKGKADIPFQEYKEFYQKRPSYHLLKFYKEKDCDNLGKNLGISLVEFVFLEKTEQGTIRPYRVSSLGVEYLEMKEACGASRGAIGTQEKGSFRIRFSVIRGCKKCPRVPVPGREYRFYEFNGIGEVDYRFEMPEEEKFDFVPLGSEKKPDVLRYPILVNDIRKTKQKEDEFPPPRKQVTFNIRNALQTKPESKLGEFSKIIVKYDVEQYGFTQEGFSPDGTYKLNIDVVRDQTLFPGELKILGVLSNGYQMLMYKPNVRSKDIDMSKELAYRHNSDRTVKKEIKLNPLFQKNNIEISEEGPGEVILGNVLKQDGSGKERIIRINNVVPYKKNGKWYVQLEAPPGEYLLAIEMTGALDKNFKWPPE